jgi:hypothetical protein
MELTRIKKSVASLAIAGSLFGATIAGVGAAPPDTVQRGGAAGLIAAVVQAANVVNLDNTVIEVLTVKNTLNNLTALNNVLNNVLNNSPILSNNNDVVDITVIDGNVNVTDVLNDLNVDIDALNVALNNIVAVVELASGDVILITR